MFDRTAALHRGPEHGQRAETASAAVLAELHEVADRLVVVAWLEKPVLDSALRLLRSAGVSELFLVDLVDAADEAVTSGTRARLDEVLSDIKEVLVDRQADSGRKEGDMPVQ